MEPTKAPGPDRIIAVAVYGPASIVPFNAFTVIVSTWFASIALVAVAGPIWTFALTQVLLARGAIHLTGNPERAMDLYLWHFLGEIPLLKVNETLLWDPPMAYHEARVGWLLLVFKVTVILPVIAAFRGYWTYTHPKRQEVK